MSEELPSPLWDVRETRTARFLLGLTVLDVGVRVLMMVALWWFI